MKKGKWNYTEDIEYKVVLINLLPVSDPPLAWQNAFIGTDVAKSRQAVLIEHPTGSFLIDNFDGSGLYKISKGGGPNCSHKSILNYELVGDLPEGNWQEYDKVLASMDEWNVNEWQKENFPVEHKRLESLRKIIMKSPVYNPNY